MQTNIFSHRQNSLRFAKNSTEKWITLLYFLEFNARFVLLLLAKAWNCTKYKWQFIRALISKHFIIRDFWVKIICFRVEQFGVSWKIVIGGRSARFDSTVFNWISRVWESLSFCKSTCKKTLWAWNWFACETIKHGGEVEIWEIKSFVCRKCRGCMFFHLAEFSPLHFQRFTTSWGKMKI